MPRASVRVCSIMSDLQQYHEMKRTFHDAGFRAPQTSFEVFDNLNGNRYEPYSAFSAVLKSAQEPYVAFCHQDVRLNQGDDYRTLMHRIEELNRACPNWGVLGNAGMAPDWREIRRITDRWGTSTYAPLPARVLSLDANFLVVNRRSGVSFTNSLSGFHFHGLDICLDAHTKGVGCYVIDFHVTHLGKGETGREFRRAKKNLEAHWGKRFSLLLVPTTCTTVVLSRYAALRKILQHPERLRLFLRYSRTRMTTELTRLMTTNDGARETDVRQPVE